MDREERAAICSSTGNTSPNNSALRLATAFSKGIDEFLEKPAGNLAHMTTDLYNLYISCSFSIVKSLHNIFLFVKER